jgi:hypothetical protein
MQFRRGGVTSEDGQKVIPAPFGISITISLSLAS